VFIELVLVAGLVMVLNSMGVVDFNSFQGMAMTLLTVVVGFIVFGVMVRLASGFVAEEFFGFSKWRGGKAPVVGLDIPPRLPPNPGLNLLRNRAAKWPSDPGASRDLADGFARLGHHRLAIQERERFLQLQSSGLTPEALITILYRITDSYLALGEKEKAVETLQRVTRLFPNTHIGELATIRIHNILDNGK